MKAPVPPRLPGKPIANIGPRRCPWAPASVCVPPCLRDSSLWDQTHRRSQVDNKTSISRSLPFKAGSLSQLALTKCLRPGCILARPPCRTPNICVQSMFAFAPSPMEKRLLETQTPCGEAWCQVVWGPLPREAGSTASLVTMP